MYQYRSLSLGADHSGIRESVFSHLYSKHRAAENIIMGFIIARYTA